MDLDAIHLVNHLSTYNFEDVVFLAADIDAIVEWLMHPVVVKDVERTLFLAHVLKTALDICRTIVRNYETLEQLLKLNWSATTEGVKKCEFYEKLAAGNPVRVIANRILLTKDGACCLGIMQEFYRMYYSKEEFKEMLISVQKSIPSLAARKAFNTLKSTVPRADTITSESQNERHWPSGITTSTDAYDIVRMTRFSDSTVFMKCVEDFREKLSNPHNEQMLHKQMKVLKTLFNNTASMKRYQEALSVNEKFYDLNIMLLKLYHDWLLAKGISYDSNVVMLLYLLQHDCLHDALLRREFLNETRLGSPERLRILLLELQNFN